MVNHAENKNRSLDETRTSWGSTRESLILSDTSAYPRRPKEAATGARRAAASLEVETRDRRADMVFTEREARRLRKCTELEGGKQVELQYEHFLRNHYLLQTEIARYHKSAFSTSSPHTIYFVEKCEIQSKGKSLVLT